MSFEAEVRVELEGLRDHQKLEDLASALLLEAHPGLEPTGGSGDEGRDAVLRRGLVGNEEMVFQYSTEKNWKSKVLREVRDHVGRDDQGVPVVYVTSRKTSPTAKREAIREAAELGVGLTIYDQRWLTVRLAGPARSLAETYLGLKPSPPPVLLSGRDYAQQLARLIPGFTAPLAVRIPTPLDVASVLTDGIRAVVLSGDGGSGKTRIALAAAELSGTSTLVLRPPFSLTRDIAADVPASVKTVLLIDDAHECSDLSGVRALLQDAQWRQCSVILTCRPGRESEVISKAGLPAQDHRVLTLDKLARLQMDDLLKNDPYHINNEDLRVFIIHLADGNPLIAHMAAVSAFRGDLGVEGVARLLQGFWQKIRPEALSTEEATVVSALALLGPLRLSDLNDIASATGGAGQVLQDAAQCLADRGLLLADNEGVAIKPDRIRCAVLNDLVLPETGPARVQLEVIVTSRPALPRRPSISSTLADAVFYSGGRNARRLERFLRSGPMGIAGKRTPAEWRAALTQMAPCAHALPRVGLQLLQEFRRAWPLGDPEMAYPLDGATLLAEAAKLAAAVAVVDWRRASLELIELSALSQPQETDRGHEDTPLSTLLQQLHMASRYAPDVTVKRNLDFLEDLAEWSKRHKDPCSTAVVGSLGVGLMSVSLKFSGEASESARKFVYGTVLAPVTKTTKELVLGAAALLSEVIPSLDEDGLIRVVRGLRQVDRVAQGFPIGGGASLPEEARQLLASSLRKALSSLVERWDQLPLSVRYQLDDLRDRSHALSALCRSDQELIRFKTLFGHARAGRDWRRQERALMAAVDELADKLSTAEAIELVAASASTADRLGAHGGMTLPRFLRAVGVRASADECARSVSVLGDDPRTQEWIPWFMQGALEAHGIKVEPVVETLGQEPETHGIAIQVLGHVSDGCREKLLQMLPDQPSTYVVAVLAQQLHGIPNLDPSEQARALLSVGQAASPEDVCHVLEEFGPRRPDDLTIPSDLEEEFLGVFAKHMAVLHESASEGCWLEPAYVAALELGVERLMALVDVRLLASQEAARKKRYFHSETLPEQLLSAVAKSSETIRSAFAEALAERIVSLENEDGLEWLLHDLHVAMCSVLGEGSTLEGILGAWVDEGQSGRMRAIASLSAVRRGPMFYAIARRILTSEPTIEEEDALHDALSPLGSGSAVMVRNVGNECRGAAEELEGWLHDPSASVRDFAIMATARLMESAARADARSLHDGD